MNYASTHAARQTASRDAIDTEPLTGKARNDFEAGLFKTVKRSKQLVLRIILDHAAGKADCWPGNKRIAEIAGFQPRNVQLIIRALEAAELVRCLVDRSLKTQRRIVILDHPNAVKVLARFNALPWMQVGAQEPAPKRAEKVHPGAQKPVHPGAQRFVGAGAQRAPAEFSSDSNPEFKTPGFRSHERLGLPPTFAEQARRREANIAAMRAGLAAAEGAHAIP
jgi:hypothetical protein